MPASKPLRHFMLEAICSLSVFLVVLFELLNLSVVPYAHGLPSVIRIDHQITIDQLDDLIGVNDILKELLPVVGDRLKFIRGVKNRSCDGTVDGKTVPTKKVGPKRRAKNKPTKQLTVLKKSIKNDPKKRDLVLRMLKDNIHLAQLYQKATKVLMEMSLFTFANGLSGCKKLPNWTLINFTNGCLHCVLCNKDIQLQIREDSLVPWNVGNYKRHFVKEHRILNRSQLTPVSSFLEVQFAEAIETQEVQQDNSDENGDSYLQQMDGESGEILHNSVNDAEEPMDMNMMIITLAAVDTHTEPSSTEKSPFSTFEVVMPVMQEASNPHATSNVLINASTPTRNDSLVVPFGQPQLVENLMSPNVSTKTAESFADSGEEVQEDGKSYLPRIDDNNHEELIDIDKMIITLAAVDKHTEPSSAEKSPFSTSEVVVPVMQEASDSDATSNILIDASTPTHNDSLILPFGQPQLVKNLMSPSITTKTAESYADSGEEVQEDVKSYLPRIDDNNHEELMDIDKMTIAMEAVETYVEPSSAETSRSSTFKVIVPVAQEASDPDATGKILITDSTPTHNDSLIVPFGQPKLVENLISPNVTTKTAESYADSGEEVQEDGKSYLPRIDDESGHTVQNVVNDHEETIEEMYLCGELGHASNGEAHEVQQDNSIEDVPEWRKNGVVFGWAKKNHRDRFHPGFLLINQEFQRITTSAELSSITFIPFEFQRELNAERKNKTQIANLRRFNKKNHVSCG